MILKKSGTQKAGMVENFFSLVFLQGVNYLLPLVTIPYLFRTLGAERYGLVAFGYAFVQYFMILTDFGFNLFSVKFISENRDNHQKVNQHVNSVVLARTFLSIFSFSILFVLSFYLRRFSEERFFFISFMGMVLGNAMFPLWFFQGMEKMKFVTRINVLAKLLSVIPFFIFVRSPSDYYQVPFYYSLGYIVAGIYGLYLVYFKMGLRFYFVSFRKIIDVLKGSSGYFLSRASLSLFTTSNAFVIGLVCGNVDVGYYAIAEKIYQAYNGLISPVNGVLFPYMAKWKDVSFFKKVISIVSVVNVIIVIAAILASGFIVHFLFDTNNPSAVNALRILLLVCFITIPSMLLGYPFLAAMGHPRYTNITVLGSAIFHVTGLFVLFILGKVSVEMVAFMVLLTELLLFIARLLGVKKYSLYRL